MEEKDIDIFGAFVLKDLLFFPEEAVNVAPPMSSNLSMRRVLMNEAAAADTFSSLSEVKKSRLSVGVVEKAFAGIHRVLVIYVILGCNVLCQKQCYLYMSFPFQTLKTRSRPELRFGQCVVLDFV